MTRRHCARGTRSRQSWKETTPAGRGTFAAGAQGPGVHSAHLRAARLTSLTDLRGEVGGPHLAPRSQSGGSGGRHRVVTDSVSGIPRDSSRDTTSTLCRSRFDSAPKAQRIPPGSPEEFWHRVRATGAIAETSVPSPGAFAQAFPRARGEGLHGVCCITFSSALSPTYRAACLGANEVGSRKGSPQILSEQTKVDDFTDEGLNAEAPGRRSCSMPGDQTGTYSRWSRPTVRGEPSSDRAENQLATLCPPG
jgi:hypothetical protein